MNLCVNASLKSPEQQHNLPLNSKINNQIQNKQSLSRVSSNKVVGHAKPQFQNNNFRNTFNGFGSFQLHDGKQNQDQNLYKSQDLYYNQNQNKNQRDHKYMTFTKDKFHFAKSNNQNQQQQQQQSIDNDKPISFSHNDTSKFASNFKPTQNNPFKSIQNNPYNTQLQRISQSSKKQHIQANDPNQQIINDINNKQSRTNQFQQSQLKNSNSNSNLNFNHLNKSKDPYLQHQQQQQQNINNNNHHMNKTNYSNFTQNSYKYDPETMFKTKRIDQFATSAINFYNNKSKTHSRGVANHDQQTENLDNQNQITEENDSEYSKSTFQRPLTSQNYGSRQSVRIKNKQFPSQHVQNTNQIQQKNHGQSQQNASTNYAALMQNFYQNEFVNKNKQNLQQQYQNPNRKQINNQKNFNINNSQQLQNQGGVLEAFQRKEKTNFKIKNYPQSNIKRKQDILQSTQPLNINAFSNFKNTEQNIQQNLYNQIQNNNNNNKVNNIQQVQKISSSLKKPSLVKMEDSNDQKSSTLKKNTLKEKKSPKKVAFNLDVKVLK